MQLVDNDTFFEQLAALFEATKETGTIWLTHKRLSKDGGDVKMTSNAEAEEYPCLVRATNGKKVNLSTHVGPQDLEQFHTKYGNLLKSSMTSTLRKRDKKREKQKAEEATRKKQRLAQDVVVEGSKRGAGRKKRQRRIKQALKQEQTRKKVQERQEARSKAKPT